MLGLFQRNMAEREQRPGSIFRFNFHTFVRPFYRETDPDALRILDDMSHHRYIVLKSHGDLDSLPPRFQVRTDSDKRQSRGGFLDGKIGDSDLQIDDKSQERHAEIEQ